MSESSRIERSVRTKRRARDLGLPLDGTPGTNNAITDVPGVTVGYKTLSTGTGAIQTGVTAILPRPSDHLLHPSWAGAFSMNGNGEMTGVHWIREAGWFTGPITLTNTFSIGMAQHATTRWMVSKFRSELDKGIWVLPVAAETYDGWLNDICGQHISESDVIEAIESAAGGALLEGNVGGGTGMMAYEFKGGTGTSSRRIDIDGVSYTVGAIVQANHGLRPWLRVCGVPVGARMPPSVGWPHERGSVIAIIATDLPLLPTQLERLAKRAGIGIGRAGTPSGNNSGDIFLAFTTANSFGSLPEPPRLTLDVVSNDLLDPVFMAVVEAVDEAVINAMIAAETVTGKHNRVAHAIDHEMLRAIVVGGACRSPGLETSMINGASACEPSIRRMTCTSSAVCRCSRSHVRQKGTPQRDVSHTLSHGEEKAMRTRDLGIHIDIGAPGRLHPINEVAGVRVGHHTLDAEASAASIRTGVTVIEPRPGIPRIKPCFAGCHILNGNGDAAGLEWIREVALLTTPIAIQTLTARDAPVPRILNWRKRTLIGVCRSRRTYNGLLNGTWGKHITAVHAHRAVRGAR